MKYTDLTLDQRIGLKGAFETNGKLSQYRAIWILCDFVTAVEYFLNNDLNALRVLTKPQTKGGNE